MRSMGRLLFCFGSLCLIGQLAVARVVSQLAGQTRARAKAGTINGRVLADDGRALEGVTVYCSSLDGALSNRNVLTDADGQFTFSGLAPSSYRITASHAGYVEETGDGMNGVVRIGDTVTLNLTKGGVITGRVTDSTGAPVVAVFVTAYRTKDSDGRPLRVASPVRSRQTDDRGIYRIYGLTAGSYHVVANSGEYRGGMATAYDFDIPSYYPSSNRDSAAEVLVQQGMEVASIDIRYRHARGHIISGTVDAGAQTNSNEFGILVRSFSPDGSMTLGTANSRLVDGVRLFALTVTDGDHDIIAYGTSLNASETETYTGPAGRVTVRGGDVSGVRLTISPGVSVAGKVGIEVASIRPANCLPVREYSLSETLIKAQRDEKTSEPNLYEFPVPRSGVAPNEKGEFVVRNLKPAQYRLLADLPTDHWYVKAITVPAATATRTVDLGRNPLATRSGDKISNVAMILGEGAAGLKGKVSAVRTRRGLWRIHLVPVEIGEADNAFVYYESNSGSDGGFTLANIAPGKYWVLARPVPGDETLGTVVRPVAWDATERAKLRREAETAKKVLDLKSCQRLKDYVLD